MKAWYRIKVRAVLGGGAYDDKGISLLSRLVLRTSDSVEAGPKHRLLNMEHFGLEDESNVLAASAFLRELQHQRKNGAVTGDVLLFVGCRTKADFLHGLSRVGDEDRYVQNLIQMRKAALWPLLNIGGHTFACAGEATMVPDIRDAAHLVANKAGGMGESEAQQFWEELRAQSAAKRHHKYVWAGNA